MTIAANHSGVIASFLARIFLQTGLPLASPFNLTSPVPPPYPSHSPSFHSLQARQLSPIPHSLVWSLFFLATFLVPLSYLLPDNDPMTFE